MLEHLFRHLHNFFVVQGGVHKGTFIVSAGTLSCDFLKDGQYYRITGSVFNDGVHQYPSKDMIDEEFTGEVWALAVPREIIDIAAEIEQWQKENPNNGKTSESFGGYSYTRSSDPGTGAPANWTAVFRTRLNAWRKLP